MKDTKRALRRHHRGRMIRHALRSYVVSHLAHEEDWAQQRARAVGLADNMAKCSCYLCGNPRRFEGRLTIQEMRQEQAARYELATELWPLLARRGRSSGGA